MGTSWGGEKGEEEIHILCAASALGYIVQVNSPRYPQTDMRYSVVKQNHKQNFINSIQIKRTKSTIVVYAFV